MSLHVKNTVQNVYLLLKPESKQSLKCLFWHGGRWSFTAVRDASEPIRVYITNANILDPVDPHDLITSDGFKNQMLKVWGSIQETALKHRVLTQNRTGQHIREYVFLGEVKNTRSI